MRNLSSTIKDALIEKGANLVGFADLKEIRFSLSNEEIKNGYCFTNYRYSK
jgi:hypothetical protein